MKAVILAAGITTSNFPEDSKPKCLFHYQGKVILEKIVRILKKVGINEIIIVGGYKIEMIKQFNEDKKLGLKVVHNPTAASAPEIHSPLWWTAWDDTIKVGLQGLDDDVLLIMGDAILNEEGMRRVIEHPKRCIYLLSCGLSTFKIPKELLPALRKLKSDPYYSLKAFCSVNNGIKMYIGTVPGENGTLKFTEDSASMCDMDDYYKTDECKEAKGRQL